MEINRLLSDELIYELKVRGLAAQRSVDENRSLLRGAIRGERDGLMSLVSDGLDLDFNDEIDICTGRLRRLPAGDDQQIEAKQSLLCKVVQLFDSVGSVYDASIQGGAKYTACVLDEPNVVEGSLIDDPNPLIPEAISGEVRAESSRTGGGRFVGDLAEEAPASNLPTASSRIVSQARRTAVLDDLGLSGLTLGLLDSGASKTVLGGPGWERLSAICKLETTESRHCSVANGQMCEIVGEISLPVKLRDKVLMKHLEESHKNLEDEQEMDAQLEREFVEKQEMSERRELFLALQLDQECQFKQRPLTKNERCRIYWNYSFPTLELVQANKPDIVLLDHQQKTMFVIEFSAPAEVNIVSKEEEKRTKYQELLGQLRRLWPNYAVSLLVMVIGSLGGMRNTLLSALRAMPVCRAAAHILAARMQKAVILGFLRLLRAHDTRTNTKKPNNTDDSPVSLGLQPQNEPLLKPPKVDDKLKRTNETTEQSGMLMIQPESKSMHKLYGSTKHLFTKQFSMDVNEETPFLLTVPTLPQGKDTKLPKHDSQESVQRIIKERRQLDENLREIDQYDIFDVTRNNSEEDLVDREDEDQNVNDRC
nr:unnamed protein product [Callosobruchus chinensis]